MNINLTIPTEHLTALNQVDVLAQIAGGMTREVRGLPENTISSLLAAAALVARETFSGSKADRLSTLTELLRSVVTVVDIEATEVPQRRT